MIHSRWAQNALFLVEDTTGKRIYLGKVAQNRKGQWEAQPSAMIQAGAWKTCASREEARAALPGLAMRGLVELLDA